jgi:hypothetical protein
VNGSNAIANGSNAIANNLDTTLVVDVYENALRHYLFSYNPQNLPLSNQYLLMNGSNAIANGSNAIANGIDLVLGNALVNGSNAIANGSNAIANGSNAIANGSNAIANGSNAIANGSNAIANGLLDSNSNNTNAAVIIYETDTISNVPDTTFFLNSINGITGLTSGTQWIIPGCFMNPNFAVTYSPGQLQITPHPLIVRARDTTTEYGTEPSFEADLIGLQYDDTGNDIYENLSFYPGVSQQFQVADQYEIEPSLFSFHCECQYQPSNYDVSFESGTLSINPAPLLIQAYENSRQFGYPNPSFDVFYDGFKFNDDEYVLDSLPSIHCPAHISSPEGNYPIMVEPTTATNYSITVIDAELTIYPATNSCILDPYLQPGCFASGNTLFAENDWSGYDYLWSLPTPGWQIDGSNTNTFVNYTTGEASTADFYYIVYQHETDIEVFACHETITNICYPEYCTYPQNFWSDTTEFSCLGQLSINLLDSLLITPLVVGDTNLNRSVSIYSNEAECLINKLPASTSLSILPYGNVHCSNATGMAYLNGYKLNNELLANTIALALSLRNSPDLANLHITAPFLITSQATSCPNGSIILGSDAWFNIGLGVYNYLNPYGVASPNNTVADLLHLANASLASTYSVTPLPLSDINFAIQSILEGFSHCRILVGFDAGAARIAQPSVSNHIDENMLRIYPNPTSGYTTISYSSKLGQHNTLGIYDMNGKLILPLSEQISEQPGTNTLEIDCRNLSNGIYFIRLHQEDNVIVKKLVVMEH